MSAYPTLPIPQQNMCIGCGYDLIGLSDEVRCPECSLAVKLTRNGTQIASSTVEYRATVRRGFALIMLSNVMMTLVIVAYISAAVLAKSFDTLLPAVTGETWFNLSLFGAPIVVSLLGYWWYATPNAGMAHVEGAVCWRKILRSLVAVQVIAAGVFAFLIAAYENVGMSPSLAEALQLVTFGMLFTVPIAWFARLIATIKYSRQLAMRMRGEGFDCDTGEMGTYSIPGWFVLIGLASFGVILPFFFQFRYVRMLWRIHRGIGALATHIGRQS